MLKYSTCSLALPWLQKCRYLLHNVCRYERSRGTGTLTFIHTCVYIYIHTPNNNKSFFFSWLKTAKQNGSLVIPELENDKWQWLLIDHRSVCGSLLYSRTLFGRHLHGLPRNCSFLGFFLSLFLFYFIFFFPDQS